MTEGLPSNDINVQPTVVAPATQEPIAPVQETAPIQSEVQVDPVFANYFDNIYQPPMQQQYVQPVQQNFQQAPMQQQQYVQPAQVQQPAFDFSKLDKEQLLEKFDEDPNAVFSAMKAQAIQEAKEEILRQLPEAMNPHLRGIEQNIELKQTQAEIANTVKGNLIKEGVLLPPQLEQSTYQFVSKNVDPAWQKYNEQMDMAILTGQQVAPTLLNNGRRFSDKEFAVKYATEYAKNVFKANQLNRIQGQGHIPQQPTANPVYTNNFPAVQNGTPQKDLRAMTAEELDSWGRANNLKV